MFSRLVVQSLISTKITLSQYNIDGNNLIISNDRFDTEQEITQALQDMKTHGINTIKYTGHYNFPDFVGAKMVENIVLEDDVSLEPYAFYRSTQLKTLTLTAENSIPEYCFAYSTIETIIGIDKISSIGSHAFDGCTQLKLSGEIKYCFGFAFQSTKIKNIQVKSFANSGLCNMYELEIATVGDTTIPENAFANCYKLTTVTFTKRDIIIKSKAFENSGIKTLNFQNVIEIDQYSFQNSKLESVVLPANLILHSFAFSNCQFLKTVTITDSIRFNNNADINHFQHCYALETVNYGNTALVPKGMFMYCYSLRTFISTNNDLEIKDEAFYSCTSLADITTSQVGKIGSKAFIFCNSLQAFNPSFLSLGEKAFYGCEKLQNIEAHDCGKYAFAFCPSITSCTLRTTLSEGVMMNCTNLEFVVLENVQAIPDKCFFGCSKLRHITFPETTQIISIGNYAFLGTILEIEELDLTDCNQIGNYSFKDLTIKNLKIKKNYFYYATSNIVNYEEVLDPHYETDHNPFEGVRSIQQITFSANSDAFKAIDYRDSPDVTFKFDTPSHYQIIDGVIYDDREIICYFLPSTTSEEYTVEDSNNGIQPYAFSNAKNLKTIKVRFMVDSPYAFAGCKSVTTAYIYGDDERSRSLKESADSDVIPKGYFANCTNLETVHISNRYCHSIGESAFEGCISLTKVVIPENIHSIGDSAFARCSNLETVEFQCESATLGQFCFANCTSLTNIKFNSISNIYAFCFSGCTKLTSFNFTNVNSLGASAFAFSSLESAVIDAKLLAYYGFSYCNKLKKVEVVHINTENVVAGKGCFLHSSLEEITLPEKAISTFYDYSFGFTKLKKLFIPDSVTYIYSLSFFGSDDIQLEINECSNLNFELGEHELINKKDKSLILTYGKLPSTYIVPPQIRFVKSNSILSHPIYNEETHKVVDFGLTTLVITNDIRVDAGAIYNAPYLHNLCYGGRIDIKNLASETFSRIFVTKKYARSMWGRHNDIIRENCDTSVPFMNYANNINKYPENPSYISYPKPKPRKKYICTITGEVETIMEPVEDEPEESPISISNSTEYTSTEEPLTFTELEKGGLTNMTIGLIIAAVVEILLLSTMIAYIIMKSRDDDDSDSGVVEMNEETIGTIDNHTTITTENGLFNMSTMIEDDPFEHDFEDEQHDDQTFFASSIVDPEI